MRSPLAVLLPPAIVEAGHVARLRQRDHLTELLDRLVCTVADDGGGRGEPLWWGVGAILDRPIVLAGGSAGAYLAARATLTGEDPRIKATIMLYGYYGDLATINVTPSTPPFLILHGTHDTLVPAQDARRFAAHLRTRSPSPAVYAELPGAGHTFDIFHSLRSKAVAEAIQAFLDKAVRRGGVV